MIELTAIECTCDWQCVIDSQYIGEIRLEDDGKYYTWILSDRILSAEDHREIADMIDKLNEDKP